MRKNKIIEIQLAGSLYVMRLIPQRKNYRSWGACRRRALCSCK